jgi:hypothetical protein
VRKISPPPTRFRSPDRPGGSESLYRLRYTGPGFPTKTLCAPLLSTIRTTFPARLILFDLITRTIFGEQYRSLTSSLLYFSLLPYYLVPLRLKYSPQHPIANTHSLRSSLNVSNQVSHPYKITGNIIVLYILIFIFLDSRVEGRILFIES